MSSFWIVSFFSSPGQSPGRAIVLPQGSASAAAALAKSLTLKIFIRWARRCQASYPVPVTGLVQQKCHCILLLSLKTVNKLTSEQAY